MTGRGKRNYEIGRIPPGVIIHGDLTPHPVEDQGSITLFPPQPPNLGVKPANKSVDPIKPDIKE
jgi:hypothetical protein